VFAPVPLVEGLLTWVQTKLPMHTMHPLHHGMGLWPAAHTVLNQSTLWCLLPEVAAQLLGALLMLWSEVPWSTEVLILVPRVLQSNWENLSRHAHCVSLIQPVDYPFQQTRLLPIPLVLLHICPYVHALPRSQDGELDKIASTAQSRWHRQQADYLRGL
jgi:hypothetical protein